MIPRQRSSVLCTASNIIAFFSTYASPRLIAGFLSLVCTTFQSLSMLKVFGFIKIEFVSTTDKPARFALFQNFVRFTWEDSTWCCLLHHCGAAWCAVMSSLHNRQHSLGRNRIRVDDLTYPNQNIPNPFDYFVPLFYFVPAVTIQSG